MKLVHSVAFFATTANAFFGSKCVNPARSTPTSDQLLDVTWPAAEIDTYAPSPVDRNQSPTKTGVIANGPELYQTIMASYSDGKSAEYGPIQIAPAVIQRGTTNENIYLVSLAGTEGFAFWEQSNTWLNNVKIFLQPDKASIMQRNTRYAILNEIPRGANVVLTGHSQGGMIARQLAADPAVKAHVNVIRTVAIGSPYTSTIERMEGSYVHVETPNDVVPKIDEARDWVYDACSWLFPWWCPELIREDPVTHVIDQNFASWQFVTAHVREYFREDNAAHMQLDAMADKGGSARIVFDTSQRAFYTAPSNTCAE